MKSSENGGWMPARFRSPEEEERQREDMNLTESEYYGEDKISNGYEWKSYDKLVKNEWRRVQIKVE